MTEPEFLECVRSKFASPEYVLLPQVRNGTGFTRRARTADALTVSLWPSRGIAVEGLEFKDNRADWLKELKDPAKAEEIGRYCSRWWVVVSDQRIVAKGELPPAWGLLHATAGGVKVIEPAVYRPAQEPTWAFVASVLKAAAEVVTPEAEIERRVHKARNEAHDAALAAYQTKLTAQREAAAKEEQRLAGCIQAFEQASGVALDSYRYHGGNPDGNRKIGEAVKFVLRGGLAGLTAELLRIADAAGRVKDLAERAAGPAADEPGPLETRVYRSEDERPLAADSRG